MVSKKLAGAVILLCFAAVPASAGQVGKTGEVTLSQGLLISTAACYYGYAKNKKTRKCVELKCKKTEMLDRNGHKCIPKSGEKKRSTYRGSH